MLNETETRAMPIEVRTSRKARIRILPFIFLLYAIAYLDRINIGFAALTMNNELAITSQQFGLLAGLFFLAISSLKFQAIYCWTRSVHASGLPTS
jgi:sugar phosphate permease